MIDLRSSALLVLGLLAAVLAGGGVSNAKTVKAFRVSDWSGIATIDDQTKQFVNCSASSVNSRGTSISYLVNDRYVWTLAFSNAAWNFSPGFSLSVTLKLGDQSSYNERAVFESSQTMQVQMRDSVTFFDALRRSRTLRVQARGISFDFDVNASDEVLPALVDCVDRQAARGHHSRANRRRANVAKNPRGHDAAAVAEANALASLIVSHAQISNAQVLTAKDIPAGLQADAVWKAGQILGTIEILSPKDIETLEALAVKIVNQDGLSCSGRLFAAMAVGRLDQSDVVRAVTSCQPPAAPTIKYYLGVPREAGGYFIFGTSNNDLQPAYLNQPAAKEMNTKVSAVIMHILSKFKPPGATASE